MRQAGSIPTELRITALGLNPTVEIKASTESIADMDYVIFPTLDLLPHSGRDEFAQMLQDLFR